MNRHIRSAWMILLFTSCLFIACSKDPHWAYFTSDDLDWMPYDTAIVQGQFIDESGNTYDLRLVHRDIVHENIGDASRAIYNNRGTAQLVIDTTVLSINLEKRPYRGMFTGWDAQLTCEVVVNDIFISNACGDFQYFVDSVTIGSSVFQDVLVKEMDTVWSQAPQCWRIYYQKGNGLLRADFRNGHYYEIQ